jgi:Type I phosphodiesterase / nucleotide pyrophosphatase
VGSMLAQATWAGRGHTQAVVYHLGLVTSPAAPAGAASGRRILALSMAAACVAAACTSGDREPPPGAPAGSPTVAEMAGAVGRDVIRHLWNGYYPSRSTDVAFVPEPYNVVIRWSGRGVGTDQADPRTSHPTPWDYHQRVPLILYGPGYIRRGTRPTRSVDVADVAPTVGALLGRPFDAPDGVVLREALLPGRRPPPRVIAVVAYDGGGWNLLEEWPASWPEQRRIARGGTTYLNATIGSAPSVTSSIHANMGTGAHPRTHGMPEITGRLPDGTVGDLWFGEEIDPRLIGVPTVADVWDRATGNRAWVGIVAFESWHLGMMSHGARWPGADRDLAVLWDLGEEGHGLGGLTDAGPYYAMPSHLPGPGELERAVARLDRSDGAADGRWMGWDLADPGVVSGTPAVVEHQGHALIDMMRRGRVGGDRVTDLVFLEQKPTDRGGHVWNMVSPEEEHTLRAQDRVLGRLVRELERAAPGRWVLIVTADHGQTPLPETTGGLRIHPDILGRDVERYFGRDIVEKVTPSGMFLDRERMAREGITLDEVARFVGDYRYGDGLPEDADRDSIPAEALRRRVFAAAIPATYLEGLDPAEIDGLGPGRYPEGRLTSAGDVERFGRLLGE